MNLASSCRYPLWFSLTPWNESQRPVLPRCFTLPTDAASDHACCNDTFVFQQDNASSHRAKDNIKLLRQETPDFIGPDISPLNSPDLIPVDYKVWGVMQQRVYKCHMNSVDVWNSLQQNVIDAAINEWRKQLRACVHADGQHFEHLLRARVMDK